jgi:hypothetical protein
MRTRLRPLLIAATVSTAFALPFVSQVSAQGAGPHSVKGTVTDKSGIPIASAEVIAARQGRDSRQVRTGEDGRFEFPALEAGATSITARRLGYKSVTLDVYVGAPIPSVEFVLDPLAGDVATVIVNSSGGRLSEFYGHKASTSFGRFFEQADIEKRHGGQVSELFRSVPGVTIIAMNGIGNAIRVRGCQPTLWVDGIRVPGTEVDEVANPTDIAAIEVYTSTAGIPVEYRDRDTRACGVIVLWSKVR